MTRECFERIEDELQKVDTWLEKLEKKYGSFEYNYKDYIVVENEELDTDYDGKRIWIGQAVRADSIAVEENVDDAESLEDISITIRNVTYTKNEDDEIISMDEDFWYTWTGDCFAMKLSSYELRLCV